MIVLPDYQSPYIINDYNSPILPKWFWALQAGLMDFTLAPLTFIEENTSSVLEVLIQGLKLYIPYSWHILIADMETSQLDWIPVSECIAVQHSAYLMSPADSTTRIAPIRVLDVIENQISYYPVMQKNCALCHPVSKEVNKNGVEAPLSIVIGPTDLSKYISNRLVGDFQ